jgi:hypothetical protein
MLQQAVKSAMPIRINHRGLQKRGMTIPKPQINHSPNAHQRCADSISQSGTLRRAIGRRLEVGRIDR